MPPATANLLQNSLKLSTVVASIGDREDKSYTLWVLVSFVFLFEHVCRICRPLVALGLFCRRYLLILFLVIVVNLPPSSFR